MEVLKLNKDITYYEPQVHSLFTPEIFFIKEYGVGNNTTNVENEYSSKALDFLYSEAKLIRFNENISRFSKKGGRKEESDNGGRLISKFFFSDDEDESYRAVFFYKDNLIFIKRLESGNYKLIFEYPAGYNCVLLEFDAFLVTEPPKHKVSVLIKEYGDVAIQSIPIDFPSDFNLAMNYGSDFAEDTNEKIVKKLSNKGAGLFIFNGEPGGGKTFYIKYLTKVVDREFIFIPSNLIEVLNSPDFLTLLMRHKNSVLVLEDAEHAIKSRDAGHGSLVSVLLNLSEGLLSSILNISIIVTHNSKEELIDKALLRRGRLMFQYEFGKLSEKDSQKLVDHLKMDYKCKNPMSLADIYNVLDDIGTIPEKKERSRIGF